jgi:DNA-entry nuclease
LVEKIPEYNPAISKEDDGIDTPIFEEDNLVASGVQMEGWSVEDNGAGICFNVYCYNVQPGIEIDYATGDSWIAEEHNKKEYSGTVEELVEQGYSPCKRCLAGY